MGLISSDPKFRMVPKKLDTVSSKPLHSRRNFRPKYWDFFTIEMREFRELQIDLRCIHLFVDFLNFFFQFIKHTFFPLRAVHRAFRVYGPPS